MKKSSKNTYADRTKLAEEMLEHYFFPPDFMGLYSYARSLLVHRMDTNKEFFDANVKYQKAMRNEK